MSSSLLWMIALAEAAALAGGFAFWMHRWRRDAMRERLPARWPLAPRPVFGADERAAHRRLREALPHHVVLSKLPLVRLCQPHDARELPFWYDLLGGAYVTFAVCSANGRVLAAIDIEGERSTPERVQRIKQAVLGACRVQYLCCTADALPSDEQLQRLVPPAPAPSAVPAAEPALPPTVHAALWQDSGSEGPASSGWSTPPFLDDVGGIVVEG